jgi:predicted nucleic acid-binding protein
VALNRLCLDTSAYSHFKRGNQQVVELLDTADWIGVPSVVIGELWLGFLQGAHLDRNISEFDQFLANPVVHEIFIDHDVGQIYAEIVLALRRSGSPLPTNDIWIAAAAARSGATVLTYDSHFVNIQRVGSIVLSQADESR